MLTLFEAAACIGATYDVAPKKFVGFGPILPSAHFRRTDSEETVIGTDRANWIRGQGGANDINGGDGADAFFFAAPGEASDRIRDFDPLVDVIALSASGFGLLPGALHSALFESNDTGCTSLTTDGVLTCMNSTERLFRDADGVGGLARVEIALLTGAPVLTAADVVVIARSMCVRQASPCRKLWGCQGGSSPCARQRGRGHEWSHSLAGQLRR